MRILAVDTTSFYGSVALLDDMKDTGTWRQIQQELTEQRLFLPLLSRGIVISHIKALDTNHRLRGTNAPYGLDVVRWRFRKF